MQAIKITRTRLNEMKNSIPLSKLIRHVYPELPDHPGNNKRCICPFHKENTASFCVNDSRQEFRCFGCGVGGDHLSFILIQYFRHPTWLNSLHPTDMYPSSSNTRKVDKVFMDCVRKLSQITGISIK